MDRNYKTVISKQVVGSKLENAAVVEFIPKISNEILDIHKRKWRLSITMKVEYHGRVNLVNRNI